MILPRLTYQVSDTCEIREGRGHLHCTEIRSWGRLHCFQLLAGGRQQSGVCDCAPFRRRSNVHDFRDSTKTSAVPNLEAPPVSQQEKASHDEV